MSHTEAIEHRQMTRLLWVVLGLRVSLFLMELLVGLWSHSLSLLAGSAHVFSDLLTLGLTLLATYLVERKSRFPGACKDRRVEIWVALLNSLSLMAIALLIGWETVTHLRVSESELSLPVLFVAVLGLAINGLNTYLLHEDSRQDLNVRGVFLHGVVDAASSFGVMLSALTIYFWHWLWADTIASLLVASLQVGSAISLGRDSLIAAMEHTYGSANLTVR